MVENKEYAPSLIEWDDLVMFWNRSRTMFSSTLATGVSPRIAWVTKNFVGTHPQASHHDVYAWLTKNLEIARGSSPFPDIKATAWHDEPTAVYSRAPRGTPNEHIKTSVDASHGSDNAAEPSAMAAGPCAHRQG